MLSVGYELQNRYHILAVLGQGGMGAAYRAQDRRLDAICVVKEMLITAETLANPTDAADQFKREASVLAMLRHPHLPRVIDYFVDNDNYYLVMDFIEGQDLAKIIPPQGLPETVVQNYANQLLDVLEYIHGKSVLHRDIKPNNIIAQPNGHLVLVDFGLVKVLDPTTSTRLFLRGVGTPEYAPPEQATGGTDARSDIYSLGATLYHALTGTPPPHVGLRSAGVDMPVLCELNPNVSARMAQVVTKAMMLNRDMRYQSAAAMRKELNAAQPVIQRRQDSQKETSVLPSQQATTRIPDQAAAGSNRMRALMAVGGIAVILIIAAVVLKSVTDSSTPVIASTAKFIDIAAAATPTAKSPTVTLVPSSPPTEPAATPQPPTVTPLPSVTAPPPFPTAYTASTTGSYPRIDRIDIPHTVDVGQPFDIEVYASNLGNDALGGGSITLSFPDQSGKATIKSVTVLDSDAPAIPTTAECKLPDEQTYHVARVYTEQTKCRTATTSDCRRRLNISYPIAEVWHKPWLSQSQHHLKVRVVPASGISKVLVFLRASSLNEAKITLPCVITTEPNASSADAVDQQGFPVQSFTVDIR